MSDHAHAHEHHGPATIGPYVSVAVALTAFTLVSFVVNGMVTGGSLTPFNGFLLILGAAVCKALLVCVVFMHLRWDWSKVYFMIVPALILAPFLMLALLPDIVLYWNNYFREYP